MHGSPDQTETQVENLRLLAPPFGQAFRGRPVGNHHSVKTFFHLSKKTLTVSRHIRPRPAEEVLWGGGGGGGGKWLTGELNM